MDEGQLWVEDETFNLGYEKLSVLDGHAGELSSELRGQDSGAQERQRFGTELVTDQRFQGDHRCHHAGGAGGWTPTILFIFTADT